MYYAPWCQHSNALTPILEDLAKEVEDIEDLIIAKIDMTKNEMAGVDVRGYPTLRFYPKADKEGIDYVNDRQLTDFKQWLS